MKTPLDVEIAIFFKRAFSYYIRKRIPIKPIIDPQVEANERWLNNFKQQNFFEHYLDENINEAAKVLLDYLYDKKEALSSYEIRNSESFKEFDIKIEDILKELFKRKLIIKEMKKLELPSNEKLISENVYSYKGYI